MAKSRYEYVRNDFEVNDKLLPSTWIVVRIDGRNFHKFSDNHDFVKPNDIQALNLMNSCAVAMLEEFKDIVFAYGQSDEYSFVFNKSSQFYQRRASKIVSITVSFFSSSYVMKWKEYFPQRDLRSVPSFDGRAICYPSTKILRDYLTWRQVDCHINNQYNTCFWMLVNESGKTKEEAYAELKGTQTEQKNKILGGNKKDQNDFLFKKGLNYNSLPAIFRKGSFVFRDKVEEIVKHKENGDPVKRLKAKVVIENCDIIADDFWIEHPNLIPSEESLLTRRRKKKANTNWTEPIPSTMQS